MPGQPIISEGYPTNNAIKMSWTDSLTKGVPEEKYTFFCVRSENKKACVLANKIGNSEAIDVPRNTKSGVVSGLASGMEYYCCVQAKNSAENGIVYSKETGAITLSTEWSSPGPIEGKSISVDNVGVYIYKSKVSFKDHILSLIELHAGAHYYVQGPYTALYPRMTATIILPTIYLNNNRIACLAFTAYGLKLVDFGIENRGSGWFAMYYSGFGSEQNEGETWVDATKVDVILEAKIEGNNDKVIGIFRFYAGNRELGETLLTFTRGKGQLFKSETIGTVSYPILRWVRFMSLLHSNGQNYAPGDIADGSFITNEQFSELKFYSRSTQAVPWDRSLIEYAWSVQTGNIDMENSQIGASAVDKFTCIQRLWYY